MRNRLSVKIWFVFGVVLILFSIFGGKVIAQTNMFFAAIAGVESQAFPQVTTFVTAFDTDGPLSTLSASDVQVIEDGQQVSPSSLTVEPHTFNNLYLVLVVDVSTFSSANFEQVKAAATTFIDSIKPPKDRMALVSFATNVRVDHAFTNNTEDLKHFVNNLSREETLTASYNALAEALALFDDRTVGRKAVIVITNSADNTGKSSTIDETISKAQEAGIPLYVVGFGNRVQSDPLIKKVPLTGGQYFALPEVDQVQPTLQDLLLTLRQGYQISYISDLKADDEQHNLSLVISRQGREIQLDTNFVAQPGEVVVKLSNLSEGDSVANKVKLTAQVIAPASEVSVEYVLDDNLLAERTTSPYTFEWDSSTLEPGPYILTARAIDRAGNRGQIQLTLNVAQPISVTLPATQNQAEIGEAVRFTPVVDIDSGAELSKLELEIDGEIWVSLTEPPYTFPLSTNDFSVGDHIFTIRVEDSLGQVAETTNVIQFLPPEAAWAKWLRTLLGMDRLTFEWWLGVANQALIVVIGLVAIIVAILTGLVLLRNVKKTHRKAAQEIRQLQIINLGNIQSHYYLQVVGESAAADLFLTLNGLNLPQVPVAPPIGMAMSPRSISPQPGSYIASTPAAASPASGVSEPASVTQKDARSSKKSIGQAKSAAAGAQGCLTTIASILTTLAQLLPGAAGRSVRGFAQRISAGESAVRRTTYAPQRMTRSAKTLQRQVGRAVPTAATPGKRPPTQQVSDVVEPEAVAVDAVGVAQHPYIAPHIQTSPPMVETVVEEGPILADHESETPVINPGEFLNVDLLIAPINPYRKQRCTFTINSKAAEYSEELVSEEGTVLIKGVSWVRRLLSILAIILLVLIVTGGVLYVTWWRLTGVDAWNWLAFVQNWLAFIS